MTALAVLGLAIFVLPFAYTTPPPVVTQFRATSLFSPNADSQRDTAVVSIRFDKPGRLTLEVRDGEGRTVATLARNEARPRGSRPTTWNGRDGAGVVLPDGAYVLNLRSSSGRREYNKSRKITIDTQPPRPAEMTVNSAALAGPGEGQCRLTLTAADAGSAEVSASAGAGTKPIVTLGPRPVKAEETLKWTWNGRDAAKKPVAPGVYTVRATLRDAAENRLERFRTCWVGHTTGEAVPANAAAGERVGVVLTNADGKTLPENTPVRLELYRRAGTPGKSPGNPLGARVGGQARGPVGRATVRLPRKIRPDALWLVATTASGRALVPLGGRP
jgi:hypothetical protein